MVFGQSTRTKSQKLLRLQIFKMIERIGTILRFLDVLYLRLADYVER